MTTNHLDASEVDSYDYLIVGGGTAVSNHFVSSRAGVSMEHQVHSGCRRDDNKPDEPSILTGSIR
jgi:hypothetical protein